MAEIFEKKDEILNELGQYQNVQIREGLVSEAEDYELIMTQSAFSHEYALMDYHQETSCLKKEEILLELDEHRRAYFWARRQIDIINPQKVHSIEEKIRQNKANIFKLSVQIH